MKIIIVSGYWNPIHIGHIAYLREAKKLGDYLIVIVNNDNQVKLKGSVPFMNEKERVEIVKAIRYVDEVILSDDIDKTVCYTIGIIKYCYFDDEVFFVKGGDRDINNIPEKDTCNRLNIKMIFGVGGGKTQSSSTLIKNSRRKRENN
ncbi:hypothetical protein LCGC14_1323170 [marine sediment metagenome]|uniref:Cytidyltransferase-like domain-containing protein n=1 Tax=marine sediment metagenome TaxID=412755 RepID=A0A0F9NL84_9ZZZZ